MQALLIVLSFSVLALLTGGCSTQSASSDVEAMSVPDQVENRDKRPVLVELFTSEGCSSCPPADRNLAFLATQQPVAGAEIITLAFHVDYWDRLGWKDRFSSPLYSRRQNDYSIAFDLNSNYTPQMVVDGSREFVGSDSGKAAEAIASAAGSAKATVELTGAGEKWRLKIANAPSHSDSTIFVALAEDDLSTRVGAGENSGKTLDHVSVVKELRTVGQLSADKQQNEIEFQMQTPADAKAENLRVVVFIQEDKSKRIIGVARSSTPSKVG